MKDNGSREVLVGRIAGVYGVKGWVRVKSFTDPLDNIIHYAPWRLRSDSDNRVLGVAESRPHGKGLVARLESINDRDAAAEVAGMDIFVARETLAEPAEGQYYWHDLEGLEVSTLDGTVLGTVMDMIETGANDVLVVAGTRRHLVPFIQRDIVRSVDLEAGKIIVDWDPSF